MAKKKIAGNQSPKVGTPKKARTKKTTPPPEIQEVAMPIAESAVSPTEVPPVESLSEAAAPPSTSAPQADEQSVGAPATQETAAPTPAVKSKRTKKAKDPKATKVSAIDAAAKVLAESGEAMTTKSMIEQMASKGYWCNRATRGTRPGCTTGAAGPGPGSSRRGLPRP
jgi:hypothetical protein